MKWQVMTQEEAVRINEYNKTVPWYKTTMGPYLDSVMATFAYIHIFFLLILTVMFIPMIFMNGTLWLIVLVVLVVTVAVSTTLMIWGHKVHK